MMIHTLAFLLFTSQASAGMGSPCKSAIVKVNEDAFTKQPSASAVGLFNRTDPLEPGYELDLEGGQVTFRLILKQRTITQAAMPAGTVVGVMVEDGTQLSLTSTPEIPAELYPVYGGMWTSWRLPLILDKPTLTTLSSQTIKAVRVKTVDGEHTWEVMKLNGVLIQKVLTCYATLVP